jgi:hypothetical protein
MIWKETPLTKFGYKCIMSKHDLCSEGSCECLCHEVASKRSLKKEHSPLTITKNIKWLNSF